MATTPFLAKRFRHLVVTALLFTALSGCASLEMPENDQGKHPMKPSPCACDPIPYNSEGYQWLG